MHHLTIHYTVIIGRLLIGFAVGTITGVAPVFGAEIAKVRKNDLLAASHGFRDTPLTREWQTSERARITAVNQMSRLLLLHAQARYAQPQSDMLTRCLRSGRLGILHRIVDRSGRESMA